jgi:hypothetical protein
MLYITWLKCDSEKIVRHILYPVDGGSTFALTYVRRCSSKGGVLGQKKIKINEKSLKRHMEIIYSIAVSSFFTIIPANTGAFAPS